MKTGLTIVCLAISASLLGCSDDGDEPAAQTTADLVDTATKAGSFKTLVAAVDAAGLTATLRGPGPFTVFAPNDAAFAKLPAGTVDTLLLPENKAMLASVLTYHVVAEKLPASAVVSRSTLPTVQGGALTVAVSGSTVSINDAKVLSADVNASNGVIHVIDSVLLPK